MCKNGHWHFLAPIYPLQTTYHNRTIYHVVLITMLFVSINAICPLSHPLPILRQTITRTLVVGFGSLSSQDPTIRPLPYYFVPRLCVPSVAKARSEKNHSSHDPLQFRHCGYLLISPLASLAKKTFNSHFYISDNPPRRRHFSLSETWQVVSDH